MARKERLPREFKEGFFKAAGEHAGHWVMGAAITATLALMTLFLTPVGHWAKAHFLPERVPSAALRDSAQRAPVHGEGRIVGAGQKATAKSVKATSSAPKSTKVAESAKLSEAGLLRWVGVVERGPLLWTARDNGSDVNWYEARDYCAQCSRGGFNDWRVPTIGELKTLYDAERSTRATLQGCEVHIASPFEISTCCVWTSSTVADDNPALLVNFQFSIRDQFHNDPRARDLMRTLCVRRSTK